jgi:hypothetical protein
VSELWEIAYSTKTKLDRKLKALRAMRIGDGHFRHMPMGLYFQATDVFVKGKRDTSPVVIRVSTNSADYIRGQCDYVDIEIPRGIAEVAKITCGTLHEEKGKKQ